MEKKFLVAVISSPSSISHTFMAEASLIKHAALMDIEIRVETNGASGVGNCLTEEEIAKAYAVIIVSDKEEDLVRFKDKPILRASVKDGIRKAKYLIDTALTTSLPIYRHDVLDKPSETTNKANASSTNKFTLKRVITYIYYVLMSGVSNMLPFVVAGGVLITISFLFGINSADPLDPSYNVFASQIKFVGGAAFSFMVVIFSGFIAQAIVGRNGFVTGMVGGVIASAIGAGFLGGLISGFLSGFLIKFLMKATAKLPKSQVGLKSIFIFPAVGSLVVGVVMISLSTPLGNINSSIVELLSGLKQANPIILGLIVGSMMAFDMGGPINKLAYITATMLLGSQNYTFMAGVMAAGMTPPLVTAFATTIFAKSFTKEECSSGRLNYLMSAVFITEGAIPFAAHKPKIVIPVFMLASSISAILTYAFDVAVRAPHGGLLILPLTTNAIQWVISILIGSLVGAIIFGLLKQAKKV